MLTIQYGKSNEFHYPQLYSCICSYGFTDMQHPYFYAHMETIDKYLKTGSIYSVLYCIHGVRVSEMDMSKYIQNRYAYTSIGFVKILSPKNNIDKLKYFVNSLTILRKLKNNNIDNAYIDYLEKLLWKENPDIIHLLTPICKRLYMYVGYKYGEKFLNPDYVWKTKGNQTTIEWLRSRFI